MAEAEIPVDLFNPGQVFACLGFLEAADVLLGDAEGGFDWSDEARVVFRLSAAGGKSPFAEVLSFLAGARVMALVPFGYHEPDDKAVQADGTDHDGPAEQGAQDIQVCDEFVSKTADRMTLPVRLLSEQRSIEIHHWADTTLPNDFKLYSGNRSAYGIMCAMLQGTRDKPTNKTPSGKVNTRGVSALWEEAPDQLAADPFGVVTRMGGSFNFDPRGGWTSIDVGYSPNEHKEHGVAASPVLEVLTALGLNNARPSEFGWRQVRYAVWGRMTPPILARPALAGGIVMSAIRSFQFTLRMAGKNRVVSFANEEEMP